MEQEYLNDRLNCYNVCLPPCDQLIYHKIVSTALWPSDPYMDYILHKVNETDLKNRTFESKESQKRFIQTNFLRLEIYFESFDFLEFVTQPKYDWGNLLGDIGGHLGLWLGFSLLTVMEVMELLTDMVLFWMSNANKKHADTRKNGIENSM